jgi:cobalt-precorrin-6B (C15)-methyltransferase
VKWDYVTPGIPDDYFERSKVPMTKEEVRTVTLSKARIKADSIIYDIGAGTGSITVETALLAADGRVYSIEKRPDALALVRENIARFGLTNVNVVEGEAPEALEGLPQADRIIIGGSGGRIEEILDACARKLTGDGIIVVNAVSLDTLKSVLDHVPEGFHPEVVQVQVSRMDEKGLLKALNPVFIISLARLGE